MAGFKLNVKVTASTLVEVLVAMMIIMVVFSIATAIYTNILRSSVSLNQIRAQAALQEMMKKAERSPVSSNRIIDQGDFKIRRQIRMYQDSRTLKEVRLIAFSRSDERLAELRKIVYDAP